MLPNYHFLLGGYDLEMIEIRRLLEDNRQLFTDKKLSWGASLEDYQDVTEAQSDHHFVGIELTVRDTMLIPARYFEIDHHNEKSYLPASIEQVAELLNITLTRHQQLVAANDRGYIPAMRAMGASETEIKHIRRLDRKAQGVTDEMEAQAEESVQKAIHKQGVLVVETPLDKFSPIVDRLNTKKLLIYNFITLNYYGEGVKQLSEVFKDLISAKKAYYGGGDSGFIGTVAGAFSETELNQIIETILNHVETD